MPTSDMISYCNFGIACRQGYEVQSPVLDLEMNEHYA